MDIVERLTALAEHPRDYEEDTEALREAADKIARLQQEMAEMQDELDELRRLLGLSLAPLRA